MSTEGEIHCGVYANVVQTGKDNKRKNVYPVRSEEAVNKISGE